MRKPACKGILAAITMMPLLSGILPIYHSVAEAGEVTISTLRSAPIDKEDESPLMTPQYNKDLKQVRNYPEQPPVIPHKIEGYEVSRNANKCLMCHDRTAIGDSQAPMVSITHFMNRDGQFLAEISPRRYFCNQCHVPQHESDPLVENDFVDVSELIKHLGKQKKEDK